MRRRRADGHARRATARTRGSSSVDISADSLAQAEARVAEAGLANVEFRQADIFDLPFEPEAFDHVFVCFLLEHLAEPVEALVTLGRLLKPGGTMTVIEGDHGSAYYHPASDEAQAAIQCQVDLQAAAGGNANIGREVYPLMVEAGLDDVRVSPRMVYVDSSRPELVDGFTKRTFTAMVEGVRERRDRRRARRAGGVRRGDPRALPHRGGGRRLLLHVLQGRRAQGSGRIAPEDGQPPGRRANLAERLADAGSSGCPSSTASKR